MLVLYVALLLCFWCNNYSFHYEDNKFKNYSASWTVPFLLLVSFCFCHVRIKHWEVEWMFWAYEQSISVSKVPLGRDSILWLSFCLLIVLLLFLKIYLVFRDWDIRFRYQIYILSDFTYFREYVLIFLLMSASKSLSKTSDTKKAIFHLYVTLKIKQIIWYVVGGKLIGM